MIIINQKNKKEQVCEQLERQIGCCVIFCKLNHVEKKILGRTASDSQAVSYIHGKNKRVV